MLEIDIKKFLDLLFSPDDLIEIRCIENWQEGKKKRSKLHDRFWLQPAELLGNLDDLAALNSGPNSANIYYGVCPRPVKGAGKSKDIRVVRVLWADVDECRPDEACDRVTKAKLPAPSIVVDSGHGAHIYWLLDQPFAINCEQNRKRIESILKAVQTLVGGDHTQDLARLLRLPGFMNVKNARNGATPVPCSVVSLNADRRYSLDQFPHKAKKQRTRKSENGARYGSGPLRQILDHLETVRPGERSEADFWACCECIRAGLAMEETWAVLHNKSKFAERGREYFDLTWSRAVEETQDQNHNPNGKSLIPSTIQVLGMDEEMRTYIWVKDTRRLWKISKIREIDIPTLIQMSGRKAVTAVLGAEADVGAVRSAIAESSRTKVFGSDDFIGQGIFRLHGVDGLLVVAGDRAMIVDPSPSGIAINQVESPIIGGKLIRFNGGNEWVQCDKLIKAIKTISNRRCTSDLWNVLIDCLGCWIFDRPYDREIIAGLILATPLQATLPFRPHVWVTGATNTGKTALFEFLGRLWPYATRIENETSEAAIRQEIRHNSLPWRSQCRRTRPA